MINYGNKASETDAEVSETTKKKHVTMEEPNSRSNTPSKMTAATSDIQNRYLINFLNIEH